MYVLTVIVDIGILLLEFYKQYYWKWIISGVLFSHSWNVWFLQTEFVDTTVTMYLMDSQRAMYIR